MSDTPAPGPFFCSSNSSAKSWEVLHNFTKLEMKPHHLSTIKCGIEYDYSKLTIQLQQLNPFRCRLICDRKSDSYCIIPSPLDHSLLRWTQRLTFSLSSILVRSLGIPLSPAAPPEKVLLSSVFLWLERCCPLLCLGAFHFAWVFVTVIIPRLVSWDRRSLGRQVTNTKFTQNRLVNLI